MSSPLKKLLVHIAHYSLSSVLTTIAGLVSFPLLTRLLSVADYGAMNLIAATLTVTVALGKVGVQHSILRYHAEIAHGKRKFTLANLYSTTFLGMAATGIITALLVLVATELAPRRWLGDFPNLRTYFAIISVVVASQVLESVLVNLVRAELLTSLLLKYQVIKKYVGLGLMIFALFAVARSLTSFYLAMGITEVGSMIALGVYFFGARPNLRPRASEFSLPLYREMVRFGIPMMIGFELAGIVLQVGDRYVIEGLIGPEPLGLYSAAYNLCQYVQAILISSIGLAIMPIYMQMFEQKGAEETAAFLSRSLRTYALFAAPVVAGVAAVGPELLPALASEKYASGTAVLPWVIAGMVVDGTNGMVGAGLFIHRRIRAIVAIVISCAALNIGLNLLLIPHLGVVGAGAATLASYAALAVLMAAAGHSLLPVVLPWGTMARSGLSAAVMYLAVFMILPGRHFLTVGIRVVAGALVYAVLITLVDRDAREMVKTALGPR